MALNLYLLRHGQTAFSRDNIFSGCGSDPELTENGLAMAQAFAHAYRAADWRAVYASPLKRTVSTARPICDALGKQMILRDDLREISYGRWEGLTVEDVQRDFPEDYPRFLSDAARYPPTGGESALVLAQRALSVVEEIQQTIKDGNVLLVSHKATIRALLCRLLGIDLGQFRYRLACPVASLSAVELTTHGPLLKILADRSHLTEELRQLPGT
jgi:broad specificity phosphatase PhoE